MDNQPNQMPPQYNAPQPPAAQPSSGMNPAPHKKGHGALVLIIVLVLAILAIAYFGKDRMGGDDTGLPADTTAEQGQGNESEDLSSIEAELEATNIDGTSDGL